MFFASIVLLVASAVVVVGMVVGFKEEKKTNRYSNMITELEAAKSLFQIECLEIERKVATKKMYPLESKVWLGNAERKYYSALKEINSKYKDEIKSFIP